MRNQSCVLATFGRRLALEQALIYVALPVTYMYLLTPKLLFKRYLGYDNINVV